MPRGQNVRALVPGSFDPISLGHLDIIERAHKLFDEVVVAIAINSSKKGMFSLEERKLLIEKSCAHLENVRVISFTGLLPALIREQNIQVLVRGLRSISDYDYERQLCGIYTMEVPELETVFLPCDNKYAFISSTLIREVVKQGGPLEKFVPAATLELLKSKAQQ